MAEYLVPGVYIQEIAGPRPIQAVGTSTPGFIGLLDAKQVTIKPMSSGEEITNTRFFLSNWGDFERKVLNRLEFSPKTQASPSSKSKKPQADGEGESPKPSRTETPSDGFWYCYYSIKGFFENGGGGCYLVLMAHEDDIDKALKRLGTQDDISTFLAPGLSKNIQKKIMDSCAIDGTTIIPRMAILTAPSDYSVENVIKFREDLNSESATLYYPWVRVQPSRLHLNSLASSAKPKSFAVPPVGYVAGIWARSDVSRGVHKAPANEVMRGVDELSYEISYAEQGRLNPKGINCIRAFPNEGIKVWGARTLAEQGSEFTYLNIRRLFNMIRQSIAGSTRWIVFEPNDHSLWKAIRRDISAFLTVLWRDGMLMGRTPEEAFFVKCDEETNPQEEINLGRVTTVIGLAPVRPAEFVIFKISQQDEQN